MQYLNEVKQLMENEESAKTVSKLIAKKLLADPAVLEYLSESEKQFLQNERKEEK